jgi:hypothetical protein
MMKVEDRSRMDWDTSRPSSQPRGEETGEERLIALRRVLLGIVITIVALPVLGFGLLLLLCIIAAQMG